MLKKGTINMLSKDIGKILYKKSQGISLIKKVPIFLSLTETVPVCLSLMKKVPFVSPENIVLAWLSL